MKLEIIERIKNNINLIKIIACVNYEHVLAMFSLFKVVRVKGTCSLLHLCAYFKYLNM